MTDFSELERKLRRFDWRKWDEDPVSCVQLTRLSADAIAELVTENKRLVASIHWALGYTNFRERGEREGAYWWRIELRQRVGIDAKIEQLDAALSEKVKTQPPTSEPQTA